MKSKTFLLYKLNHFNLHKKYIIKIYLYFKGYRMLKKGGGINFDKLKNNLLKKAKNNYQKKILNNNIKQFKIVLPEGCEIEIYRVNNNFFKIINSNTFIKGCNKNNDDELLLSLGEIKRDGDIVYLTIKQVFNLLSQKGVKLIS